jgi:hypothetical protein
MGALSLRPNGYSTPDSSVTTGAASIHAALSDNSNASYIRKWPELPATILYMTTGTKPAGAVVKELRVVVVASSISVNSTKISFWFNHGGQQWGKTSGLTISGTTPVVYYGPFVNPGNLTQADIDNLTVSIDCDPLNTEARFYEVYLDVVYAELPSVTATAPTGTITSSEAWGTWTASAGADSSGIAGYLIRIYNSAQYNAGGFTPYTAAWYDSGSVWSTNQQQYLAGMSEDSYRMYVWVFQITNGVTQWSDPSYVSFTVDITDPPVISEVVAFGVDSEAANTISVIRDVAGPAWTAVQIQCNHDEDILDGIGHMDTGSGGVAAGWTAWVYQTPTGVTRSLLSTPTPWDGQFQRLQGTLDDGDHICMEKHFPVRGGDIIRVSAMIRANALPATSYARVVAGFYNYDNVAEDEPALGGWTMTAHPGGSGWKYVESQIEVPVGGRTGMIRFDVRGMPGAAADVVSVDFDDVVGSVNGVGWQEVRADDSVVPLANEVSFKDRDVPPREHCRYRAKGINGLSVSPWYYAARYASWDVPSGVWFKDPHDDRKDVLLRLAKRGAKKLGLRRGWFRPTGGRKIISVWDARDEAEYNLQISTYNHEEADALEAVCEGGLIMIHAAAAYRFPSDWYAIGDLQEVPISDKTAVVFQEYSLEVGRAEGL